MIIDPDPASAGRRSLRIGASFALTVAILGGAAMSIASSETSDAGAGGSPAESVGATGAAAPPGAAQSTPSDLRTLDLRARDGHRFQALEGAGRGPGAPDVLLIPDLGKTGHTLLPLVLRLRAEGYHVLAMDNTGQSRNIRPGRKGAPSFVQLDTRVLDKLILDVEAAGAAFRQNEPARPFAVAGYGIGGNLAIMYADETPEITAIAMVLPGHDCSGFDPNDAVALLGTRPALLIESDKHGSTDLSRLFRTVKRAGVGEDKEQIALPRLAGGGNDAAPFGADELVSWLILRVPVPRD